MSNPLKMLSAKEECSSPWSNNSGYLILVDALSQKLRNQMVVILASETSQVLILFLLLAH